MLRTQAKLALWVLLRANKPRAAETEQVAKGTLVGEVKGAAVLWNLFITSYLSPLLILQEES